MGSRFVRPDTRTLTLEDGATLTVRARLTSGEYRAGLARTLEHVDGRYVGNPILMGRARVTSYLLDWSLKDDDGRTVQIRDLPLSDLERTLDQLSPEAYDEIESAILAHESAMAAEREAEKKTRTGPSGSGLTSQSPSDSGGDTNGSGILTRMSIAS